MDNQKFVTIYTLGIGILPGIIYGFKEYQDFLTGNIEQLLYDIGVIFGGYFWPLGIALFLAIFRYFYLLLRKKPKNFLLIWMQIGSVTTTLFLILILKHF